jgi:hypothetical protein
MKFAQLVAVLAASAAMLMSNGASAQSNNHRKSSYSYENSRNSNSINHGNRQGSAAIRPANVVTVGGQYIGQDPDAHVRAILQRDYSGHLGN